MDERTSVDEEHWDMIIEPHGRLIDIQKLRDVWHYRDLLILFVKRDFVSQYKQTILGPLWHLLQPVFTTIIFLFVFTKIANIPTDGIKPVLFYLSGITIWNYFSVSLTSTSSTFVTNAGIFGKVYFPRMIIPLSVVLSNMIRFGIQFLLLLGMMVWYAVRKEAPFYFDWSWLLIPVLLIVMAGIGLGLGIIVSSLTTKYRDLNILITFAIQLLMYVTPVAYPLSFLNKKSYKWIVEANPLTPIVEAFRHAIFNTRNFEFGSLIYSVVFMFVSLFLGVLMFNKVEQTFMDTV
jgi:lipopolysaccharide transport system permease protein